MSDAATPKLKKAWSGWWEPPEGTSAYAAVPYVASIVPLALSVTQKLVLSVVTRKKKGTNPQEGEAVGFVCDPGGYTRIAKDAGVCRKTAYNAIKDLIAKGVLRVFEIKMRGKQRAKTLYFAPHFRDVLSAWRADESKFKTDRGSVVVMGRKKEIVTTKKAGEWNMNPATAPKRGSGRARDPEEEEEAQEEQAQAAANDPASEAPPRVAPRIGPPAPTPPGNDERIAAVLGAMQRRTFGRANLKDAMDALTAAQTAVPGIGADVVVACIEAIAGEHEPSAKYPMPRPKWIIDRLPQCDHWITRLGLASVEVYRVDEDKRQRFLKVDPEKLDPDGLEAFHQFALDLRASGRATPEEIEKCDYWIARLARMQAAG